MKLIFFLGIPLYLAATGRIRAEYDSASKAIVNCTFPENSTKRDFTVYFFYENGETELLVDCAWIGDKLECIEQRGFNCRLLVPNTAEIEVPQTYVTRPSKIGYTLSGDNPDIVNFCHFVENSSNVHKESENKKQLKIVKENNNGHKEWVIGLVIGAVLAVVVIVGIVLYKKKCRRNTQTETSEESDAGIPSLVSTENSSRDDKSSHSTVKYHVVLTEQSSSPINEEEKIPLNSQSVKDDNNIQVFIKEKNC